MSPPRNGPSKTETAATTRPTATATTTIARLAVLLLAAFASTAAATTTATAASAAATAVALPSQILEVVPACATECLATFVQNNYQGFKKTSATSCPGNSPSFACLCEHTGANGFTIGEAALSCLTLEAKSGACTSTGGFAKAFDAVKRAAYFMCSSADSRDASAGAAFTAAQQTHRTIVATAVVGSEFAANNNAKTTTTTVTTVNIHSKTTTQHGFSTITTGTLTSTHKTSSSSTSASASTATHSPLSIPASSLPTTLITAPSRSTSSASTTTTTTSSSTAGNTSSAPSPRLSKAQIIGISVGSVAALIIAVVAYIALRAFRRRRGRESELFGDMGAFPVGRSNSKDKDSGGFSRLQEAKPGSDAAPNATGNGHELQISSPMHLQQPAKYQNRQASPFNSRWHEKVASQQSSSNDESRAQKITSPIPALRPSVAGVSGVANVARNPFAQQTPYTLPATIRPVNNTPSSTTNARQDTYIYNRPIAPRVLTTKALPARPGATYDQTQSESLSQSQSYSQTQPSSQPPSSNYGRGPALPADWRPRPPASLQQQQQQQQPQQPQSLQTMVEEDEEDEHDNNFGFLPPPPQGRIFGPPVTNRDSVVTEFAEDGEDEYSLRTSGRVSGRGSGRGSRGVAGTTNGALGGGYRQEPLYSASNNNPYEFEQPYMSPSIVPRPLVPRQQQGQSRPLAAQRLGDDRAAALRLNSNSNLQQPRQKQNWQRMNSVIL